jgi:hypothetical protein
MILRYNICTVHALGSADQLGQLNSNNVQYDLVLYNHTTVQVPHCTVISWHRQNFFDVTDISL